VANLPRGKVTALNVEAAKAHMISIGKLVIPVPMSMRMSFSVNRSDKLPEIRNLSVYQGQETRQRDYAVWGELCFRPLAT